MDGFAAPQDAGHSDKTWAAKLVLEMEPKLIREFWLCDLSPKGAEKLEELRAIHAAPDVGPNVALPSCRATSTNAFMRFCNRVV